MVELNRVDQVGPHTYEIYGQHHLPHKGEHKLVATVKMNFRENSLADCQNLPVLFMNAQVYRDENMRLHHEIEKLEAEVARKDEALVAAQREITALKDALAQIVTIMRDIAKSFCDEDGYEIAGQLRLRADAIERGEV